MQTFLKHLRGCLVMKLSILCCFFGTCAAQISQIPMTPEYWTTTGQIDYPADGRFRQGVLDVKKGSAQLKVADFHNGVIDFDMFMPDHGILGVRFRQIDRENAEALYFRPQQHCDTASDCMQYMPLEHGAFEWDLFPQDQAKAALRLLDWNHLRMVVEGHRLTVYLNGSHTPTLLIRRMEGGALGGGLSFGGPAQYANLTITKSAFAHELASPQVTKSHRYLRKWEVTKAFTLATVQDEQLKEPMGITPPYSALPPAGHNWTKVSAEENGIVNFSREVGSAKDGAVVSMAWAKTVLRSNCNQTKVVSVGWVREVWIYLNGTLIFSGRNLGGLPAGNVADERISLKNGTFRLPLRKGDNEIVIALDDNLPGNSQHYGWGMELRLRDTRGVRQQSR